ncbi:hypothetical protein OBBRIDRAFT_739720 [Obba rivulosa]|uniref:Uncharacterized protein n=1 Tax=Obba rivulosa TaxID=1052685 RepID=A0A8E2DH71_9APHY|nr:hypothetical protein OBBRIDRAFT_739720 [Obba rivulosa]
MGAQGEKRILWHPRHENKFVVGGNSQITLYEWHPASSEIKQLTSQLDLFLMKCCAWSPDATLDDLVAIGLMNGKVDLIRLKATKYARNHILASGPSVTLPPRTPRACNALSWSSADPNMLAVGLEKARGNHSLIVWDVQAALPALTLKSVPPASGPAPSHSGRGQQSSSSSRGESRNVARYVTAETVSSVSFLPQSKHLLLAGVSNRSLRLFDLRTSQISSVSCRVNGIATDPLDMHRVACFGDGIITVLDTRRLSQPLLTFTEKDAAADGERVPLTPSIAALEFSNTRRGVLASLGKDAHYVRFWDLRQAEVVELSTPDGGRSRDSSQSQRVPRSSWTNPSSMLPWGGSSSNHAASASEGGSNAPYNLVLADTRHTRNCSRPLVSFALVPSADSCPLTSNVMVANKQGDLELHAVHDTPKHTPWSARGDVAIGTGRSYRIIPGFRDLEPPPEPWDIIAQPSVPQSKAHSVDRHSGRAQSAPRDRAQSGTPPPLFGRGDEEGFPALSAPSNVISETSVMSRRGRSRTYSPAATLRSLQFEYNAVAKNDLAHALETPTIEAHHGLAWNGVSFSGGARQANHRHRGSISSLARPALVERSIQHVVAEDISMVMRRRVIKGYGLINPRHNFVILKGTSLDEIALPEVWLWINHAEGVLCWPSPKHDGYNFAYQGVQGIWEGFKPVHTQPSAPPTTPRVPPRALLDIPVTPAIANLSLGSQKGRSTSRQGSKRRSHHSVAIPDDFVAAVLAINARNGIDKSSWRPLVATNRLPQRRLALQLCGWSLAEDDLAHAIRKWEKEERFSQAACWLVFTEQHKAAVELLMRSTDETHHMMSGMLAALTPPASGIYTKNPELMEHCERLVVRLQDPYLRAMLSYLIVGDWAEVLLEELLPLRERLAIAFQFLDDRELSPYLRRVKERCCHDGDIEGLIVTGLTPAGMDVLQAYVDITSDVQTAAILSSLSPFRAHDARAARCIDVYRDLLDGWKLFHHRCQFDIDRGKVLQRAIQGGDMVPFEWAPRQILIRCNYCNKPMDPPFSTANTPRPTACPNCARPLPKCCICLMTLDIAPTAGRNHFPTYIDPGGETECYYLDTMNEALVFCQTCRHGGHASHILQWFYSEDKSRAHGICPVAGCDCRCADEL